MNTTTPYKFHAYPPMGNGERPKNAVFEAVHHTYGESVIWRLDQNGWAIGYEITRYETQGSKP